MNAVIQESKIVFRPMPQRTESFLGQKIRTSQAPSRPGRFFSSNPGQGIQLTPSRPEFKAMISGKDYLTPTNHGLNFPIQTPSAQINRPFTANNSNRQRMFSTKTYGKPRLIINTEDDKPGSFGLMVKKLYTPLNQKISMLSARSIAEPLVSERSPNRIQSYLLGKEIGKGAYAVVKYAIHRSSNRKVAIKIYEKAKFQDSSRLRNAQREIQILKKLNHSNVLKMYEAIDTEDHLYLVLELITGLSLNDYVKKFPERRLAESDACKIFYQILQALEYCHNNDVTHRDIKFDNVLLDYSNNVKLIDFGFSTRMAKDMKTKIFCGTPSYMAPEIIKKEEYFGPPVDIWACGVVLFGMLCGYFPFKSYSDKECYKKILEGVVKIPSFVSSDARELIEKILVLDPQKRLTAKEILANPWFKKLGNTSFFMESGNYPSSETEIGGDSVFSQLKKKGINDEFVKKQVQDVKSHLSLICQKAKVTRSSCPAIKRNPSNVR
ncbi:hypothetical protein SteCoe_31369 [Stentor coeruleus]|uniref:Protein kinase domain-containing protein n=1 Tax=Stentor coeruleus TaxID=5963 RepID=A0A1R2B1E2_9CILI|nr:hypothetical protein SteCoe_31369 [Stentor coeruleus]